MGGGTPQRSTTKGSAARRNHIFARSRGGREEKRRTEELRGQSTPCGKVLQPRVDGGKVLRPIVRNHVDVPPRGKVMQPQADGSEAMRARVGNGEVLMLLAGNHVIIPPRGEVLRPRSDDGKVL